MKRIVCLFSALLAIIAIFTFANLNPQANEKQGFEKLVTIDGITYATESYFYEDAWPEDKEDKYYVIGFEQEYDKLGNPNHTEIIFKDEIEQIPVVGIDTDDFKNCIEIEKIVFSKNMTDIYRFGTFSGCKGIIEVVLSDSVRRIPWQTFQDCSNLEKIVLPKELRVISPYAFKNCTKLKNITIPEKVNLVDAYAFYGCKRLEEISFLTKAPEEIEMGKYAFKKTALLNKKQKEGKAWIVGNGYLVDGSGLHGEITLNGKNISSIANYAFVNNKNIQKVTIKNVEEIGEKAFKRSGVETLIVKNVNFIRDEAFAGSEIETAYIRNVPNMAGLVFKGCKKMKNCTLSGMETIYSLTFYRCNKLKKITLGKKTKVIEAQAFAECKSLVEININSNKKIVWEQSDDIKEHKSFGNFYKCNSLKKIKVKSSKVSKTIKKAGIPKGVELDVPNNAIKNYKKYVRCKVI